MGKKPKVFISYSWNNQAHQEKIREWADRLIEDGIEVLIDVYDLKEGHDKNAFMEKMVTDKSVTHVLIFSDKMYTEKANDRKRGVGAESQIISQDLYNEVEQTKFIPIVLEFQPENDETPFLPVFLSSRVYVDFSSPEKSNENWERLIRLIYDKPLYEKPALGPPPVYVKEGAAAPASPLKWKLENFRQAVLREKKGIALYRKDFLKSCIEYVDSLRIRNRPSENSLEAKIAEDYRNLIHVRNNIVDWILFECSEKLSEEFYIELISFMEQTLEMKYPPDDITTWKESWLEAHRLFVYEIFLYIIASLLINYDAYSILHKILTKNYLLPSRERGGDIYFNNFTIFYHFSEHPNPSILPNKQQFIAPAAEIIKRHANREDISFEEIMQADCVAFLMSLINAKMNRWYPQTLHYAKFGMAFPLFIKASRHDDFAKFSTITGIQDVDSLRKAIKEGEDRFKLHSWDVFRVTNIWEIMNLNKLDTID